MKLKLTKSKLKQLIREELEVLREAKGQYPNLVEASKAMMRDPDTDPGSPDPSYENPSQGWHRLSKTEFEWLVDAIQSLQGRSRETDSELQYNAAAMARRFETIEARLLADSDPENV
jgi:hypothetical protein